MVYLMDQVSKPVQSLVIAGCLLIGHSGCALERSSVSIDSNSRSPWFGLQLLPSKKADTSGYHRSISRQPESEREQVSIVPALANPRSEFRIPAWLKPSASPESQQLPQTTGADPVERSVSDAVEFW